LWLHADRPLSRLVEVARAAEEAGAAAILVADEGTDRDMYVALAVLAQYTRRVLLFGAITNPWSRHPLATAAAYATLAELAPGRIVAGFGAGGTRVLEPLRLEPARPFTALKECVDVVEALLRGEVVDHNGEFQMNGQLSWRPGSLPIAIAGRGPRVERLAAERGDWVLLAGRPIESVAPLVERLRSLGKAAIAWNPNIAWTEAMRADVQAHLAYMVADMPPDERTSPEALVERYGVVGERSAVVGRLAELRETVRPELFAFDAFDYSVAFVAELGAVAREAGIAEHT
jgi:5,10-methylenetetrahydromethanopterin reductase